jgi:hypothetical protein
MNRRTLRIVSNDLLQEKILAEANIEHYLMDDSLSPKEKSDKINSELNKLKDASLKLTFWEEFITNNIIIHEEGDNELEK